MDEPDYSLILSTLQELPFPVGKRTLLDILSGAVSKKMLTNDAYMDLEGYGSLQQYPPARIEQWIDRLLSNGLIAQSAPPGQPHMRVLQITQRGLDELKHPTLSSKRFSGSFAADSVDEDSRKLIAQFGFFLEGYNEEQQHAIVSPAKKILCVAGAGSGKTTVLTKRIEFLVRYRGVEPKSVLAITFTRKARAEMQARLRGIDADVTTFNGFCERLLRRHGKELPLLNYGQRIRLFRDALEAEQLNMHELILEYFTDGQRKGAKKDELERRLIGDVYSIIDHYSNEDGPMPKKGRSPLATTLLTIAARIQASIEERGVRDYSGQLSDALELLRKHPERIPQYTHVLVDEYQDVNVAQARLLELLRPPNLFVVGDPRQGIFGWRGSQLRYITDFPAEQTIQLRTNYRSRPAIVSLMNALIAGMGLPDLVAENPEGGTVQLLKYGSEDDELQAVATLVAHASVRDIFVLARTNRQLQDLSVLLSRQGVPHSIKAEEDERVPEGLVLGTVHAIKGLEAYTVIVMGATSRYFPCKVSDHPVVDLIKETSFDREEEEKRLLYVAVSRAKEVLLITYTSTPTYFLDAATGEQKKKQAKELVAKLSPKGNATFERLREWRARVAKERGLPAYTICTDRALHDLVEQRPQSLAELRRVHGLGDSKIRQFGEQILDVLHG